MGIWITSGAIALAIVIAWIAWSNIIVRYENEADEKYADINNNLLRRAELIPNLVATVRGYADHERRALLETATVRNKDERNLRDLDSVMSSVDELARKSRNATDVVERNSKNSLIPLDRLMMLTENYPTLQASANFLELQEELAHTEDLILISRRLYNNAAKAYNNIITTMPGNIVAHTKHAKKKAYLTAPESAKATPKLKF